MSAQRKIGVSAIFAAGALSVLSLLQALKQGHRINVSQSLHRQHCTPGVSRQSDQNGRL